MENTGEGKKSFYSWVDYKCSGKSVGIIGMIFNTIGIVFFLAYGVSAISVLFNVIFWMFGKLSY